MAKKQKYYVVWEGNNPGVYNSWTNCQLQIKGYPGAKYKSFKNKAEAEAAFRDDYREHYDFDQKDKPASVAFDESAKNEIVWDSISVDAACSGNPGIMEYQGVDTTSKQQIFHKKFSLGTNNIGEFLALVHALAFLKKEKKETPIYSDSKTALAWVRRKKCKTKLARNARTEKLFQIIERAEWWLNQNHYPNKLMKWETERWGEIPADFGRK